MALGLAQIMGDIDAKVAVPGIEQALVCRSKKKTYKLFKNESFCPAVYENIDEIKNYPVFVKPDKGQGGKGAFKIEENSNLTIPVMNFRRSILSANIFLVMNSLLIVFQTGVVNCSLLVRGRDSVFLEE